MTVDLRLRHVAMAVLVLVLAGLAAFGIIGPAVGPERITSYDVVATIREDRTVAVREVIDWDFGGASRRGIFRTIPSDGGVPTEVEVTSPDAPDDLQVTPQGSATEVRIGDPDVQISGRHRYVISYVLPSTVAGDRFALDAVGSEFDVPIEDATVLVQGAELTDTGCFVGAAGATDTCEITDSDGGYRVQVEDLDAGEGVTVDGDVVSTEAVDLPALPPFDGRADGARLRWALVVGGLAAVAAVATFVVCRQLGRNEVAGGGATEAAFAGGSSPFGPHRTTPGTPAPGTRMVADSQMGELAGIEFVPPDGVEPWQASVVLREQVDDRAIGSWFAGQAAHDVLDMTPSGSSVVLSPGPRAAEADADTASILNRALAGRDRIDLNRWDHSFSSAWTRTGHTIGRWARTEGVFRRRPPQPGGMKLNLGLLVLLGFLFFPALASASASTGVLGLRGAVMAVLIALLVPVAAGWFAYGFLTRSLSARGSAIALRSESFRRFLHDSEAQHVEWAFDNGLLREYSAWAVALGEADAWNQAMAASAVPPPEIDHTHGIMAPVLYSSAFHSARTAPSSSGGGGGFSGGGFSGGGMVGGGGGGGGGGSW